MSENTIGYELDWDGEIENDGPDFVVLPAGDYDFEVTSFERGRHAPREGGKLPACNKATLSIKVFGAEEETTIRHTLFLHSSTEGLLCEFFLAIGQRQHGEKIKMNWNAVVGAKGRCKIALREFVTKSGEKGTANEIKRFYEPAAPAAAVSGTYQAGRF